MQKPTLAVRAPRNLEDFVNGQRPAVDRHETNGLESAASVQPRAVDVQTSATDREQPSASAERSTPRTKMRGMVKRASGAEVARVTVYLSPDAAMKLRRHCFDNGLELSEVAGKAVERYVAKL